MDERGTVPALIDLLEVDHQLRRVVFGVCKHLGAEECDNMVGNDLYRLCLKVIVVDAEVGVEPINFVRDQLAGDETLIKKRCVSGCSSEVMRPGEAHQDIGAGQTVRAMQTRPTLSPTMHSYSISYALASLAYSGRICANRWPTWWCPDASITMRPGRRIDTTVSAHVIEARGETSKRHSQSERRHVLSQLHWPGPWRAAPPCP